ncbi:hypothetical protein BU24DRAFT_421861 [Aaosphaeria arxii CBS 175.79]|uniref:DUF7730 domain-containing protein n=1 Tax=Aaosphaeria arxii CBS 175.79 TaxID=1450172 RepID=A0A6A5XS87_9PLEO|nr:uncharacterized protein BU24DRAFT_421861 [Aaosphaeria arxii CBS 175.79]KAF2015560.1 hypothetical protein BU24DRAFT_421861 [Aaosphaeria arxii CBS 175.79]
MIALWQATSRLPSAALDYIKDYLQTNQELEQTDIVNFSHASRCTPAAALPATRKRALSMTVHPKTTSMWSKVISLSGTTTQRTIRQENSLLLTKLPPELRNMIYQNVLGDRVLHIIPSLVPSRSRQRSQKSPPASRFDYATCKWPKHVNAEVGLVGQRLHSACAIWIGRNGELYFNVPQSIWKGEKELDTSFLRWWNEKNRLLALLRTCRLIYSEAVHILYATNTFDFLSLRTFVEFPRTILPSRTQSIRTVNLRIAFTTATGPITGWSEACATLKLLKRLRRAVFILDGPNVTVNEAEAILGDVHKLNLDTKVLSVSVRWVEQGSWTGISESIKSISS